jgi:hypothetical protein
MSKRPPLYVVRERGAADCKIVPILAARPRDVGAPPVGSAWPRETSWRDLVRRLARQAKELR